MFWAPDCYPKESSLQLGSVSPSLLQLHRGVTHGFGNLVNNFGGCITCGPNVIAQPVLFAFCLSAGFHELLFNTGGRELNIVVL